MPSPRSPWLPTAVVSLLVALGCLCGGPDTSGGGATAGGWPATMAGACQSTFDCGCPEWSDVASCVATMGGDGVIEGYGGAGCWVAQSCTQICGGGATNCVKEAYARASAQSAQMHKTNMEIIDRMGNRCPGGTVVRDANGNFVRCQ